MGKIRKPFQGLWNVIRFNWHFYLLSFVLVLFFFIIKESLDERYRISGNIVCFLIIAATGVSLLVTFYVYDLSGLYKLKWLDELKADTNSKILNINAGFDETSILLQEKFPDAELIVFDFYDPIKHTEVSIKRARKAYPAFPRTIQITTLNLPLPDKSLDKIFIILSAHEIRDEEERNGFFRELKRILKQTGQIVVIEHLRDVQNFLAYNVGFFHFIPKASWRRAFKVAELTIFKEIKINPFITIFILEKNGIAS